MNGKVKFPFIKPKKVFRKFPKRIKIELKKLDVEIERQEKKLKDLKFKRSNIELDAIMGHIND